jgi:sulfur-carrier protein adenylyltransferase/sulfurtransferase
MADRVRRKENVSLLMYLVITASMLLHIIDSPSAWSFPLSQPGLLPYQRIIQHQSTRAFNGLLTCCAVYSSRSSLSNEEISRYSRHLVLSDVGIQGQETLKNSSVLVIGAGGLGSPCLLYLAAAGVGHVGIVDADTVDASNLQRQIIHGTSTIGVSKCKSAKERMQDINPHVHIRLYEEEFTSESALRILQGGFVDGRPYNVVIDGSDNFPTKYLINDACHIVGVPWVYSAILAFEGQLSIFNYKNGPTYRDMLPTPPPPGEVPSCAEGGVLGVLPG